MNFLNVNKNDDGDDGCFYDVALDTYAGRGGELALWSELRVGRSAIKVRSLAGTTSIDTFGCIPQHFESASAEKMRYIKYPHSFIYLSTYEFMVVFFLQSKICPSPWSHSGSGTTSERD
jgi:hypothetical protein